MEVAKHETCIEYFLRRLSEGWRCVRIDYPKAILLSPEGVKRELDLRNDVETLRPNAAGSEESIDIATSGAGNHHNDVDEAGTGDDSTTKICTDSTTYQRDLYNLPASSGSGIINFIKVYFKTCGNSAESYAKPSLKSNSTVTDGTEIDTTDTSWILRSEQWNTNPADSAAWEWADVDALQIGVSLKGGGDFPESFYSECTQVYVEVDYTGVDTELTLTKILNHSETAQSDSKYYSRKTLNNTDASFLDSIFYNSECVQLRDSATFLNTISVSDYLYISDSQIFDSYLYNIDQISIADSATIAKIYALLLSKILYLIDVTNIDNFLVDTDYAEFKDAINFANDIYTKEYLDIIDVLTYTLRYPNIVLDTSHLSDEYLNLIESIDLGAQIYSETAIETCSLDITLESYLAHLFSKLVNLRDAYLLDSSFALSKITNFIDIPTFLNSVVSAEHLNFLESTTKKSTLYLGKNATFSDSDIFNYIFQKTNTLTLAESTSIAKIYALALSKILHLTDSSSFENFLVNPKNLVFLDSRSLDNYIYNKAAINLIDRTQSLYTLLDPNALNLIFSSVSGTSLYDKEKLNVTDSQTLDIYLANLDFVQLLKNFVFVGSQTFTLSKLLNLTEVSTFDNNYVLSKTLQYSDVSSLNSFLMDTNTIDLKDTAIFTYAHYLNSYLDILKAITYALRYPNIVLDVTHYNDELIKLAESISFEGQIYSETVSKISEYKISSILDIISKFTKNLSLADTTTFLNDLISLEYLSTVDSNILDSCLLSDKLLTLSKLITSDTAFYNKETLKLIDSYKVEIEQLLHDSFVLRKEFTIEEIVTVILSLPKSLGLKDFYRLDIEQLLSDILPFKETFTIEEVIAGVLELIKTLELEDSFSFDIDVVLSDILSLLDSHTIDSYFVDAKSVDVSSKYEADVDYRGLLKKTGFSKLSTLNHDYYNIKTINLTDTQLLDYEYYDVDTLNISDESILDYSFYNSEILTLSQLFTLGNIYEVSFDKLLELSIGSLFVNNLVIDKLLYNKSSYIFGGKQYLSFAKIISLSDAEILDYQIIPSFVTDSSLEFASTNQFSSVKHLTFKDVISSVSSQTLSFSKLLELSEAFELTSSQTLELSKILALSQIFSLGEIETLSVSEVLNLDDTIKLDYLYYLVDGLSLEETIDVIAIYLGVPVKCITTTLSKMSLATTLTKLGLEDTLTLMELVGTSKKITPSTTLKKIALDSEIANKCD